MLLVTVPSGKPGKPGNMGWLQQFDAAGLDDIVSAFGGLVLEWSFFKLSPPV